MLEKKDKKEIIQSFIVRAKAIEQYVSLIRSDFKLQLVELTDAYGPAITDKNIQAIVVSEETVKGANAINAIRLERGMEPLKTQVIPILMPGSLEVAFKLSSTLLREYILTSKNQFAPGEFKEYKLNWQRLCRNIDNLRGQPAPILVYLAAFEELLQRYSEYWRFYHTNHHIYELLETFNLNQLGKQLDLQENIVVFASLFYHDIVYLPNHQDNQQQSAKIADSFLVNLGLPKQLREKVWGCIMCTASHKPSDDRLQQIVNTLDMAILQAPLPRYQRYAAQIREEYWPLAGNTYPEKRVQFLNSMLNEETS